MEVATEVCHAGFAPPYWVGGGVPAAMFSLEFTFFLIKKEVVGGPGGGGGIVSLFTGQGGE